MRDPSRAAADGGRVASGRLDALQPLAPLFASLADAVAVFDRAGRVVHVNPAFEGRYGWREEDLGVTAHSPLWPPERREEYRILLKRLLREAWRASEPASFGLTIRDSEGGLHDVRATVVPMTLPDRLLVVVVHDAQDPRGRLHALERSILRISAELHQLTGAPGDAEAMAIADRLADQAALSPRQRVVLEMFARGDGVDEMAERLCVSPHTVRGHLKGIYRHLGVHSQRELRALIRDPQPVLRSFGTNAPDV